MNITKIKPREKTKEEAKKMNELKTGMKHFLRNLHQFDKCEYFN